MTYFRASFSSINGDDIEEKSEKDTKEKTKCFGHGFS